MGKRTKNKQGGLGRTLVRAKNKSHYKTFSERHVSEDNTLQEQRRHKMESIIEQNDLNEFMNLAVLANRDFTANQDEVTIVVDDMPKVYSLDVEDNRLVEKIEQLKTSDLPIPRRPRWNEKMTAYDLHEAEKKSFLIWRKSLTSVEQDLSLTITPYEKNINVWRQLWRVIERSQVVVQIVDCRNPLLFRSVDLESYIAEVDKNKLSILMLNKADLLTKRQRFKWAEYLHKHGIKYLFFSAHVEQDKIDHKEVTKVDVDDIDVSKFTPPDAEDWTHVYTRDDLLYYFKSLIEKVPKPQYGYQAAAEEEHEEDEEQDEEDEEDEDEEETSSKRKKPTKKQQPKKKKEAAKKLVKDFIPPESTHPNIVVGFVGYPNVGKSSLINVLCGRKRVTVSSTPGKTKHFQTIPIGKNILLCDCPGLVFPSVRTTKPDMICDGILPIDQMRDHRSPIALVCQRIPASVLELTYGIKFDRRRLQQLLLKSNIKVDIDRIPLTAEELLYTFAQSRSMMSHKGIPNAPHVARIILKDYVNGKLIYCHPPPEDVVPPAQVHAKLLESLTQQTSAPAAKKEAAQEEIVVKEEEVDEDDDEYFTESEGDDDEEDEDEDEYYTEEDEEEEEEPVATKSKQKGAKKGKKQESAPVDFAAPEDEEEIDPEELAAQVKGKQIQDLRFNEGNINVVIQEIKKDIKDAQQRKRKGRKGELVPVDPEELEGQAIVTSIDDFIDPALIDDRIVAGSVSVTGADDHQKPYASIRADVMQALSQASDYHDAIDKLRKRTDLSSKEKKELKNLKRKKLMMKKYI